MNSEKVITALRAVNHFENTTPAQANRGTFHEIVATTVDAGLKDVTYFRDLGISPGDISDAFKGKPIRKVRDDVRGAVIREVRNSAEAALGFSAPHA